MNKISKFPYSEAKESIKYYYHIGNISKETRNEALRVLKHMKDALEDCDIESALFEYDKFPNVLKLPLRKLISDMIKKSCGMGKL